MNHRATSLKIKGSLHLLLMCFWWRRNGYRPRRV